MKSQDMGILLKLVSLQIKETKAQKALKESYSSIPDDWSFEKNNVMGKDLKFFNYINDWRDWDEDSYFYQPESDKLFSYSVREIANETGISKTQVSLSLQRILDIGLARRNRKTGSLHVNTQAFLNFILHAVRYVFPVKPGEITRGIATAFAAPVLENILYSAGDLPMVWPDARGKSKGQAITPLFKSATYAIRHDKDLYAMLALIDAIRIGLPRESKLSGKILYKYMEL